MSKSAFIKQLNILSVCVFTIGESAAVVTSYLERMTWKPEESPDKPHHRLTNKVISSPGFIKQHKYGIYL